MARNIEAFKLRSELIVDGAKAHTEYKKLEGDQKAYGKSAENAAKQADSAWSSFFKGVGKGQEKFQGAKFGKKFGEDFGASAVSAISGTFSASTLGGLIGTAIAPGIGTAVGSAIGGGIDAAISKVAPIVMEQISGGIALNKLIEETAFEFKTFAGNEQQATKYLNELLDISRQVGILPQILIDASEKTYDLTGNLKLTRSILKAATDQAADFGGSVEVFQKVADVLGLIAEKGELTNRELRTMYKMGIDAKKYLLEATGLQDKQLERLMAAGRIRGDVAARLISEGIERDKGGYAAARTGGTVAGRERQFGVLMQLRAMEGTKNITRGLGDFYEQADAILNSPQAQKVVAFIDKYAGTLVDFTEKSLKVGVSVGAGVAEGILNFNPANMMQSFSKLSGFVESGLKTVFEIKSPSELSAREIGEPIGEGIGVGMVRRFKGYVQGPGKDEIIATLEQLLKDPRVKAFLDLINRSEVGNDPNPAARLFGPLGHVADPSQFFAATGGWPGMKVKSPTLGRVVWTHPLGGKQIEPGTAKAFSQATGTNLPMDAHTQDLIAAWLITQTKGALEKILAGDPSSAMNKLRPTWESFAVNSPGKTAGLINQFNASVAGKPIDRGNPMPVYVVRDIEGGAAMLNRQGRPGTRATRYAGFPTIDQQKDEQDPSTWPQAIVPDIVDANRELIVSLRASGAEFIAMSQIVPHAMKPLIDVERARADASIELTKKYQEAAREELIKGISIVDQITGALGQVAGMIPSQTVGKKRGLLSKILGFAAPFLSFIPGVGPILSTIAGAASNIAGGNIGAAVSSIAGGFATGGVFRSGPKVGSGSPAGSGSDPVHRAWGGLVRSGQPYIVGERRPELFVPESNGWIHPSVPSNRFNPAHALAAMGGGGRFSMAPAPAPQPTNVHFKQVLVYDPRHVHDAMRSDGGEQVFLEFVDRHATVIRRRLRL